MAKQGNSTKMVLSITVPILIVLMSTVFALNKSALDSLKQDIRAVDKSRGALIFENAKDIRRNRDSVLEIKGDLKVIREQMRHLLRANGVPEYIIRDIEGSKDSSRSEDK